VAATVGATEPSAPSDQPMSGRTTETKLLYGLVIIFGLVICYGLADRLNR
jgi:hypothetical protein